MPDKNIWIVNFHTAPPEYALNQRYTKIVPHLQRAGYKVTVISSSFLRRHNKDLSEGKTYNAQIFNDIPFILIKTKRYKGNGLGRMFAIFMFSLRLLFIRKKFGIPDVIYHNLHVPFDVPVYFAAKRFGANYVTEVWDLWPEFFHRTGLIRKNHPLMKLAYQIERWIYTKAKAIVFTLEGGRNYISEKKWDKANGGSIDLNKIHYVNNGIDINQFEADKISFPSDDLLIQNENFNVVYVGSMHKANDVLQLIKAAEILKTSNDIHFILYGDGSDRDSLIAYCQQHKMDNVTFKEKHLPFHQLPAILCKSSLNVMNYQKNFGDYGVSAGKLFLYLAAGKPILSNVKINYCVVRKNKLGVSEDLNSPLDYANGILKIKNLKVQEYNEMCLRVKEVANEFDYSNLSKKLIEIF
jgi:glycosyltransferase involved in cell wall biosynthesis